MKKAYYIFLSLLLAAFTACSDDDNPAENKGSQLDGVWQSAAYQVGGEAPYEYNVSLDLAFPDSKVTGEGTINYSVTKNGITANVTIKDELTGSYNNPNINIGITDGTTGYIYNYVGKWTKENEIFEGTMKITIDTEVYTYQEVNLFISDED